MAPGARSRTRSVLGALVAVCALATPRAAWSQAGPALDAAPANADAQAHFNRARGLFLQHEWAAALDEFRAANALFASPNTRMYIARCLRETGQLAAAFAEFERAGTEAGERAATEPRYAATRDTAQAEGAAIRGRIATLTLHVPSPPEGLEVSVNGQTVTSAGWEIATPFDPGEVTIAARAVGRTPYHERVTLAAGQSAEVSVALVAPPEAVVTPVGGDALASDVGHADSPHDAPEHAVPARAAGLGGVRVAGLVIGAVGLVGVATFAIPGALANGDYATLGARCPRFPCDDASVPGLVDDGERWQTLANVGLTIGLVGLVTGAILLIAGAPPAPSAPAVASRVHGTTVWAAASRARAGVVVAF